MKKSPEIALYHAVREGNALPLTSVCNLKCLFCSNPQNPPGVEVFSLPPLPRDLLKKLFPLLNPRKKIIIGEAASRISEGEPFTHPAIWEILEDLRRAFPKTQLQVTTNGVLLREEKIKRLSEFKPLEVNISLNSSTAKGRRLLMGDRKPIRVKKAIEEFNKRGIPFNGSIVALPHIVGWGDLKESCFFLDLNGARTIRLLFAGFTRFAPKCLRFSVSSTYKALQNFVSELNDQLQTTLLLEPPLAQPEKINLMPKIEGLLPGSPAALAGLKKGDIILEIYGKTPFSRVEAFRLVQKLRQPQLAVLRNGRKITFQIKKGSYEPSGLVINYDLNKDWVSRLHHLLKNNKDKQVLLLSSLWGLPFLRNIIKPMDGLLIHPARNRFFGGSIACAGLLTVSDFQAALLQARHRCQQDFDLILLPALAFDNWGRDLLGNHYLKLRNHTKGKILPFYL